MYQWVCNQVLVHLRQVHLLFRTNVLALLVTATACPIGVLPRLAQTALRSVHVRPALTPHPTSLSSLINVCSIESQLVGEISISHRLQTTNSFSCCIGWVGAGVQGPSDGGLEFSRAHQGRNVWHHDEGSCDLNLVTSLASLRSLISHNDIHGLRHGTCRHFILIFLQSHTLPVAQRVERLSARSFQLVVLPQFLVGHRAGVVTLNSCATPLISRWHSLHFQVATSSSGLMSVVRVTVPQMVTSLPGQNMQHCLLIEKLINANKSWVRSKTIWVVVSDRSHKPLEMIKPPVLRRTCPACQCEDRGCRCRSPSHKRPR